MRLICEQYPYAHALPSYLHVCRPPAPDLSHPAWVPVPLQHHFIHDASATSRVAELEVHVSSHLGAWSLEQLPRSRDGRFCILARV